VARQEYWRAFRNNEDYRVVPFILARVEVDFRSEALVKEALELCIRCSHVGTKSFGFEYLIREAETKRIVVEARTVQVFYDYATKTSMPCPDDMRARLEAFEGRALTPAVRS
jgi:acyl-CoA thioester hydrolase